MAHIAPQIYWLKNGTEVTLRSCTPEDAPLFIEFQKSIAAETTHTYQYVGQKVEVEKAAHRWSETLDDPRAIYLGAFVDNRLIGQVGLHPMTSDHPWIMHIARFGMMVLKEFWGQGLGTKFLAASDAFAQSQGYTRIQAMVRTQNDRAIALYKKAGYQIEGTRKNAALIDGSPQDEFYIAKLF